MMSSNRLFSSFFALYRFLINIGTSEGDSITMEENIQRTNKSVFFILLATLIFHIYTYFADSYHVFALPIILTYIYHIITLILNFFKLTRIGFIFYIITSLLLLMFIAGYWGQECSVQLFMIGICLEVLLYYKDRKQLSFIFVSFILIWYLFALLVDLNPLFQFLHLPQQILMGQKLVQIKEYSLITSILFIIINCYQFIYKIQSQNKLLNQQILLLQQTNASLEESKKMQKLIFDNSYDGQSLFAIVNQSFELMDCNEQTLHLFECPDKETYMRNYMHYHCDASAAEKRERMLEDLTHIGTYTDELLFQTHLGKKFWARRWVKKVDLNGKTYVLGSIENINEAKEAANKIIESKARLLSVFNSTTDRVWAIGRDLCIQYFNTSFEKAYTKYWGKSPNLGISALDVFQDLHISTITQQAINWKSAFEDVLINGHRTSFEVYVVYPDGLVYIAHTLNPIIEVETGEIIGCTAWSKDISEQKRIEARILRNEYQLEMAQEIGKFGSFVYEVATQAFKTSQQLNILLELDEQANVEKYFEKIHPNDKRLHRLTVLKLLKEGESMNDTVRFVRKNGEISYFKVRANPFFDDKKQLQQVIGTLQDITEHKRIEEELTLQNKNLEKVNKELDSFVYSTAHDLRAPVSSALGLIDLMSKEDNKVVLQKYIELQQKCLEKLDLFICDIILFSHNSRQEMSCDEIDFSSLIKMALDELRYSPNIDKIQPTIQIESISSFHSDPYRIKIILRHILSNALQYADNHKKDKSVNIDIKVTAQNAFIQITDNGIGIKAEMLPHIFEMFFKGTNQSNGSGIGLYIVNDTVHKIGGDIKIDSELGVGTNVRITIPNC